jgi:hypothetical protein
MDNPEQQIAPVSPVTLDCPFLIAPMSPVTLDCPFLIAPMSPVTQDCQSKMDNPE